MWVYHSMAREDLTNTEDMRYQLLDYCYGVANRTHNDDDGTVTERRSRGRPWYRRSTRCSSSGCSTASSTGATPSLPQYPAQGYNIDMVIVGAKGRLAVECDGDFWHGPSGITKPTWRVNASWSGAGGSSSASGSRFSTRTWPASLKKLWETLDELDIRTADWIDPSFD